MELDKNSIIEDTEVTLEKLVKEITGEKVEMAQKYADYIDVGYEDCETDAWNILLYYPSPTMPKRSMSNYLYWWIYSDLYEAVLDKLTAALEKSEDPEMQMRIFGHSFLWAHLGAPPRAHQPR